MAGPGILVIRHYKERKAKCSLQALIDRDDIRFLEWRPGARFAVDGHILLEIDAPELSPADTGSPLLVLDSTWRYLAAMRESLEGPVIARSLPKQLRSAYPRKSKLSEDPKGGLASVEALYAALRILGHRDDSLLRAYHWREEFLQHCSAAHF